MSNNDLQIKPQRLVSSTNHRNDKNPRKFYNHFLFKPLIITFFLVIIQFFPSEPPGFVTQSIFSRSWEVIHLIFVGIIVSYGLFSRKNDDPNEEDNSKFDHAQSYMSRLFHVSDENDDGDDDKKIQTWNSKYVRNEPMIVVAEKSCVLDDNHRGIDGEKPLLLPVRSLKSRVCDENDGGCVDYGVARVYKRSNTSPVDKGFSKNSESLSRNDLVDGNDGDFVDYRFLRVYTRSNTSPIENDFSTKSKTLSGKVSPRGHGRSNSSTSSIEFSGGSNVYVGEDSEVSKSLNRSNSSLNSKGFSSHSRRHSNNRDYGELNDGGVEKQDDKVEESVVLSSPIPWRSRSGRMEMKGESNNSNGANLLPPKMEDSEDSRIHKPRVSPSNSPSTSSPKELSPNPNVSSPRKISLSSLESQAKNVQDFGSRKNNYNSRLPPPPPPPPPPPSRFQTDRLQLVTPPSRRKEENMSSQKDIGWQGNDESSRIANETRDFLEHVVLESDDESDSEAENYKEERKEIEKVDEGHSETPDVDKKADEFIAKFREQIRLQRIESIKKSTGQVKRSSVR